MAMDDIFASSVMLTIGTSGIFMNALAIILIIRLPHLRNPFGFLFASHCLTSIAFLGFFVFWASPITFLGNYTTGRSFIILGIMVHISWNAALHTQLIVAVNRLVAIGLPLSYRIIFSIRNVKAMILLSLCCALAHFVWYLEGCEMYFNVAYYSWLTVESPCTDKMYRYGILIAANAVIGVTYLVDFSTFLLIRKRKQGYDLSGNRSNEEQQLFQIDTRFFMQAFLSDTFLVISMVFYCIVGIAANNTQHGKWAIFLSTNVNWQLHQTIEATVYLVYNPETRQLLLHPKKLWKAIFHRQNGPTVKIKMKNAYTKHRIVQIIAQLKNNTPSQIS